MTLRQKTFGAVGAITLALLLVVIIAISGMRTMASDMESILQQDVALSNNLRMLKAQILEQNLSRELMLSAADIGDTIGLEEGEQEYLDYHSAIAPLITDADTLAGQAAEANRGRGERGETYHRLAGEITNLAEAYRGYHAQHETLIDLLNDNNLGPAWDLLLEIETASEQLVTEIDAITAELDAVSRSMVRQADSRRNTAISIMLLVAAIALAITILIGVFAQRILKHQLGAEPSDIEYLTKGIARGELDVSLGEERSALGIHANILGMRDQLRERIEADRRQGAEMARIKVALDCVSSCVLVTDNEQRIRYLNHAARSLFESHAERLATAVEGFDPQQLEGRALADLHPSPDTFASLLAEIVESHHERIELAGLFFDLSAAGVRDAEDRRLGAVVEWRDVSGEVTAENEVRSLVDAARQGNLAARAQLGDKQGFLRALTQAVNELLDVNQAFVNDLLELFEALSSGDLRQRLSKHYDGDFAILKDNANRTIDQLASVLSSIQTSSLSLRDGVRQIAEGNDSLNDRTQQQAASLEETSASMEQMTGLVQNSAESARDATELSAEASDTAEKGGAVVAEAVEAMASVSEASGKIESIVSLIDEIAFQTTLLALNAAVEAARAGDAGRGFAVVASEVRTLAQRSADAAKQIGSLIKDTVDRVERGTERVNRSGETLQEIVHSVRKVNNMIAEIATSAEEQSLGIEQVNKAVMQMDEMTQKNAHLVQRAASSSNDLEKLAAGMTDQVAFFQLPRESDQR